MQSEEYAFTIDVGDILRKKYGKVSPLVVKAVEKLIHVDMLNGFFRQGWYGVDFATECLRYLNISVDVEGLENLSRDGRYTMVCNHPLGGADALTFVDVAGRFFDGNVRFQVNDFLMYMKGLSHLFVPVNKTGAQSRAITAQTEEIYSSDKQMCVFPAGSCSRKIDGIIQDRPWGKTIITKSVKYHRDIVPMHFYGRNSNRFYRVDKLGKLLGMKFPLAMVLLPDELCRARGKSFRLVIGKPIPWQTFDDSKKPLEWSAWVREKAYSL